MLRLRHHPHFLRKKIHLHYYCYASPPAFLQFRHNRTSHSASSPPPSPSPHVPSMTLYNSLTSTSLPLISLSPPSSSQQQPPTPPPIAWYTCGPTVYDSTHLGHARTYTLLDILHRLLSHYTPSPSPPPLFVMNITDVDDKILARASRDSLPPLTLARRYETVFWTDMARLNVRRPHVVTRVSEHVETSIIPHIKAIEEKGMAYMLDDGLYFDVGAFEGTKRVYGRLMMTAGGMAREGGGTFWSSEEPQSDEATRRRKKRDPRDFALWKKCPPTDPLYWSSPWGDGRPGWHVECSAMIETVSSHYLPPSYQGITVHAGGIDLKFPHHVNEMAQAEAASGKSDWISHWVHPGHLTIRGRKMSKSEKNFITVEEYWRWGVEEEGSDSPGDDWRLWCLSLSGSYRSGAAFSWDRLREARIIRQKIVQFMIDAQHLIDQEEQLELLCSPDDNTSNNTTCRSWSEKEHHIFRQTHCTMQQCHEALNNDLDGKTFLKHLLDLINLVKPHLQQQRQQSSTTSPSSSVYNALTYTLSSIRDLLETLGFSETTYRAGLSSFMAADRHDSMNEININTTTTACLNAFVNFRAHVRQKALTLKDVDILKMCDDVRDEMAVHGVEIMDGTKDVSLSTANENNDMESSTDVAAAPAASLWRPCVPKTKKHATTTGTKATQDTDISTVKKGSNVTTRPNETVFRITDNVPVQDLFKVGQYKGQFSSYDDEGIPLMNANGDEVSKSMRKKLMKKREKFMSRKKQRSR